jgi:hypothetical protein
MSPAALVAHSYLLLCWACSGVGIVVWSIRLLAPSHAAIERSCRSTRVALASRAPARHAMTRLPGNQSLSIELVERELALPRWPASLDGLTILHLTDLHFSGRIERGYFEAIVEMCQQTPADLVAITGDVLDSAECIEWLPHTLGRLRAPHGVYFIRGNHEMKVDDQRMRRVLESCGLICLSGRWLAVDVRGTTLILAGNELPWFPPAADLSGAPPRMPDGPPRMLLSHSPDQLAWARRHDIDLMLAGHVHGGQVRLPILGAVLSPSRHGIKYACGLFHEPPTAMFVSRGISAEWPIRYLCAPELARLTIRSPQAG